MANALDVASRSLDVVVSGIVFTFRIRLRGIVEMKRVAKPGAPSLTWDYAGRMH